MIDGHVHLENRKYHRESLMEFIDYAKRRNISEIWFVEHTHLFKEYQDLYEEIFIHKEYGSYQRNWHKERCQKTISDYINFINESKEIRTDVKINFGLEVCYFPGKADILKYITKTKGFDFFTGSIHWIDGWGFDHIKTREEWENRNINDAYLSYYSLMRQLIETDYFDNLAHPDSIKCFNHYPKINLVEICGKIANLVKKHKMRIENSAGLHINYGHEDVGINRDFLQILKKNHVNILPCSDAHRPEDIGRCIDTLYERLKNAI